MIHSYERERKQVWTPKGREAFANSKKAINDCPTLFLMNDESLVYLHTDACDYGLGWYLFQVIEEKEIPLALVSKTRSDQGIRWDTT